MTRDVCGGGERGGERFVSTVCVRWGRGGRGRDRGTNIKRRKNGGGGGRFISTACVCVRWGRGERGRGTNIKVRRGGHNQ